MVTSRQEAITQGLLRYFTGRPCCRGHICERRVSTKACIKCAAVHRAAHIARQDPEVWREKERVRCLTYVQNNRVKSRASARKSMAKLYAADPKRFIARSAEREAWLKENNPIVLKLSRTAIRAHTNAKKYGCPRDPESLTAIVYRVWEASEGKCAACASTDRLELDHILALARGGTNDETNLQFLCKPCNTSKNDQDWEEWLASRVPLMELAA